MRETLRRHGYTYDGIVGLLGPVAHAALGRGDPVPALRATTGGTPLETLVRLFLLGTTEPSSPVGAPYVEACEGGFRAALDLRPYDEDWYVVSDLGSDVRTELAPAASAGASEQLLRPDHVLGVGGASVMLAQSAIRRPVGSALDLGTGCGVQALHLSTHAARVTATDRNPRALRLARLTAELNGVDWELLEGDLFAPVEGRTFDLVVANPPFVVGPARDDYAYRDAGVAGDAISERLVREAPRHLVDGGVAQLLANWVHVRGADWRERVASWVGRCDALVLQREVQDPAEYVATWQRDAGDTSRERAERWLAWFEDNDVEAVGFGLVTLRRTDAVATVTIEHAPQPVHQPIGPHLAGWLDRVAWLRSHDLLGSALRVAPDVTLEQAAVPGAEGWEVVRQTLRQHHGLNWHGDTDAVGVALAGACDGTRPLGAVLDVLAAAYDVPPDDALPAVRHLVERGFLWPPDDQGR